MTAMPEEPPAAPRDALPRMSDRLALGQTGLAVSPFCLGWVRDPDTIGAAFDAGINFFFLTTDMHWPIYEAAREGLAALLRRGRRMRDRIVVAAVSYVTQPEFTYLPFQELLDAVPRLGRIDAMVIGGAYGGEFAVRQPLFRRYVADGEFGARAVAASFHDRAAAVAAINAADVDVAFVRYNPVHVGAETDLFPHLQPSPTRIFNFKSTVGYTKPRELRALGVPEDHWLPAITDYYRFALTQPAIDGILCSLRAPREVVALDRALQLPPLDPEERQYLIALGELTSAHARNAAAPAEKRTRRG